MVGLNDATKTLSQMKALDVSVMPPDEAARHWTTISASEQRLGHFGSGAEAALQMVDALCASGEIVEYRANQMRGMVLHDGFRNANIVGDCAAMRQIGRRTEEWFAKSGHLTLGVASLLMEARECHFEVTKNTDSPNRIRSMLRGLAAAQSATYFTMRSGRPDTMREATWLYAFFLEHVGQRVVAVDTLERFLTWVRPDDFETRGVTLSNIHGLLLRMRDWDLAKTCLSRMNAISEKNWKPKSMFLLAARAERELRQGRLDSCQKALATAYAALEGMHAEDRRTHREYLDAIAGELSAQSS